MIFAAYLMQVTLIPDIAVFETVPNLIISVIAVCTVVFGRKAAFCISAIAGIITEVMIPGMPGISIVLYPAMGFVGCVVFSDKTDRKLQEEIAMNKTGTNASPYLRTALCAAATAFVFEVVFIAYAYLVSTDITFALAVRAAMRVVYTTVLTIAVMFPLRYILGLHRRPKKRKEAYQEA